MGGCLVASILMLGSHSVFAGIVMFGLSGFALSYGLAVMLNWRGGTELIAEKLSQRGNSPLRLASTWLIRLAGAGIVGIASILVAGALRVVQ